MNDRTRAPSVLAWRSRLFTRDAPAGSFQTRVTRSSEAPPGTLNEYFFFFLFSRLPRIIVATVGSSSVGEASDCSTIAARNTFAASSASISP